MAAETQKRMKVLVIDDENATLGMFRLFLNAYGYETHTAENGADGLRLLETKKPDIVFTDLKMPGMDGFEVLKRIKKAAPRTEVIVITGHGDMDMVLQALNLDASDFINKPIGRHALESALKRAEQRLARAGQNSSPVAFERCGDIGVLRVDGPLTREHRRVLENGLDAARPAKALVIAFGTGAAVNGPALSEIVRILSKAGKLNIDAAVAGLSRNFKTVFEMVGVARYAEFFTDADEAIRKFGER